MNRWDRATQVVHFGATLRPRSRRWVSVVVWLVALSPWLALRHVHQQQAASKVTLPVADQDERLRQVPTWRLESLRAERLEQLPPGTIELPLAWQALDHAWWQQPNPRLAWLNIYRHDDWYGLLWRDQNGVGRRVALATRRSATAADVELAAPADLQAYLQGLLGRVTLPSGPRWTATAALELVDTPAWLQGRARWHPPADAQVVGIIDALPRGWTSVCLFRVTHGLVRRNPATAAATEPWFIWEIHRAGHVYQSGAGFVVPN